MTYRLALLFALAGGCEIYFGDDDPPAVTPDAGGDEAPDAALAECLPETSRTADCRVDLSAVLDDFSSGLFLSLPVTARVTTAWDHVPFFPPETCAPLWSMDLPAGSGLMAMDVPCDSPLHPPVLLLEIVGADVARMAYDFALACDGPDPAECGPLAVEVPVVPAALEAQWRAQMLAEGMPDADTRGLVVFLYKEADGSPAAGVVPTLREGTQEIDLVPGVNVRFLAADRATLVRFDAPMTGAGGLAILAIPAGNASVGGTRGADTWTPTGVLAQPGWIFYEDKTIAP